MRSAFRLPCIETIYMLRVCCVGTVVVDVHRHTEHGTPQVLSLLPGQRQRTVQTQILFRFIHPILVLLSSLYTGTQLRTAVLWVQCCHQYSFLRAVLPPVQLQRATHLVTCRLNRRPHFFKSCFSFLLPLYSPLFECHQIRVACQSAKQPFRHKLHERAVVAVSEATGCTE